MMPSTLRHQEFLRGKILYYLSLIYPRTATLPLLQGELDICGYPVTLEELQFHIAYLVDKGFAAVDLVRGPHSHHPIGLVKITARGIDLFDGRLPSDEGVYLEPKV